MLNVAAIRVFLVMIVAGIIRPLWDTLLPNVYAWALVGMALNASLDNCSFRNSLKRGESGL